MPEQWSRSFDGAEIRSVQQTSDGGYILAGWTGGFIWLIKTDANGNEQWNITFGGRGGYMGEDVKMQDKSDCLIYLNYESIVPVLGNIFFGLGKAKKMIGQNAKATG